MKFAFKNEGDQWWHVFGTAFGPAPGRSPTYRRCHADPDAPFAEPT
jgi:hypothetical protein